MAWHAKCLARGTKPKPMKREKKGLGLLEKLHKSTLGLVFVSVVTGLQIGYTATDAMHNLNNRHHEREMVASNARYRALADEVKELHVKLDLLRPVAARDTTGTKRGAARPPVGNPPATYPNEQ